VAKIDFDCSRNDFPKWPVAENDAAGFVQTSGAQTFSARTTNRILEALGATQL